MKFAQRSNRLRGSVLIIAGSDCSGGAGVQADIKTVTVLGAYGMGVITVLTAQNTQGITDIFEIPAAFVKTQIETVLQDITPDVIKIGMLGSAEIVKMVAALLPPNIPVVLDPVMVSTNKTELLPQDAIPLFKEQLLPKATLVTPNIPEAEALLQEPIKDLTKAAHQLQELSGCAVLLKGGHLEQDRLQDVLVTREGAVKIFEHNRIKTTDTHGTGCALSSAVAVGLAQGLTMIEAVREARDFVLQAIQSAPGYGKGHGPINHACRIIK